MNQTAEGASADSLAQRYEALIRVMQAIGLHREIKDVFRVMSHELQPIVAFDGMVVIYLDPASDELSWQFFDVKGLPFDEPPPPPHGHTVAKWVIDNQEAVVISDLAAEIRFGDMTKPMTERGLASACMLPLTTVHRRIGTIGLASRQRNAFDHEDLRFLTLLAGQSALIIDDALNLESMKAAQNLLKRSSDRLQLLLRLNNAIVSSLDLKEVFRSVSASIREAMRCDVVGLLLPDPSTGELVGYALDFPESNGMVTEETPVPSWMREAYKTSKSSIFPPGVPRVSDPIAEAEGLNALCDYPLLSRDRLVGVLVLARRASIPFSQEDTELLSQIGQQVLIAIENALAYRKIAELKDRLTQQNVYLEGEIRSELNFEEIVGKSEILNKLLKQVETVAPTDSTVLIYGDTGTGKELIARALHNLSARAKNSFVKLNCAAIPTGLLESELFGHERGAFTGAIAQRIGRFELANQGSVFLDEIGEIPLETQPKLLRVLQEREFERLGSSRTLKSDARLIAATNRDLAAMVSEQKFRADLFYRLSVFPIYVPPLRDRKQDIPLLVRHFVQHYSRRMNLAIDTIPSEAMDVLVRYHWPGNIRELQNLIERAVILTSGPVLNVPLQDLQMHSAPKINGSHQPIDTLEDAERRHVLEALKASDWVIAGPKGAAQLLGLKRSTLQARMEKLGIRRARVAE